MTPDRLPNKAGLLKRSDWWKAHGFDRDPFLMNSFWGDKDQILQEAFLEFDDCDFEKIKGPLKDGGYVFIFASAGGGKSSIRTRIKSELGPKAAPEDKHVLVVEYTDHSYDVEKSDALSHVIRLKLMIERTLAEHSVGRVDRETSAGVAPTIQGVDKRADLRRDLERRFSIEELRTLYFDHGGDPENLPKENKVAISRELVAAFERQGRISELIEACRCIRPDVRAVGTQAELTTADYLQANIESARDLLVDALALCRSRGFDTLCILVDVDSEGAGNDSAFQRILPLASAYHLFDIDGLIFKFLLPLEHKSAYMTLSKRYPLYEVKWDRERLRRALEDRLVACQIRSKKEAVYDPRLDVGTPSVSLLAQLCTGELRGTIENDFIEFGLAMDCPRAMWQLGYYLLEEHLNLSPNKRLRSRDELIERSALDSAYDRLSRELPSYAPIQTHQTRISTRIVMQQRLFRALYDYNGSLIDHQDYEVLQHEIMNKLLAPSHFDRINRQIAGGDILHAIDEFLSLASRDLSLYDEANILRTEYVGVERDERKGLQNYEQAVVAKNQIADRLSRLLEKLLKKLSPRDLPIALAGPEDGSPSPPMTKLEKIIGINNLKQIPWIARGLECARSVCRVLTPDGVGTGFLVAPDLIMTNNHVIRSAEVARQTRVEFNYQLAFDGSFERACRYGLDPERFCTDVELDYTLVKVLQASQNPPLRQWGYLKLNPSADPVSGEHVSIIQHPYGGLKQIVMTANQVVGINSPYLWYTTDTMGGSSGSPVFNDLWQVIALHHAAAESGYNEGILISHVKPRMEIQGFWPKGQPRK